jgi:hypothetical protein
MHHIQFNILLQNQVKCGTEEYQAALDPVLPNSVP